MRSIQLIAVCAGLMFETSLSAAEPFDQLDDYVNAAMKKWQVPGLAIAVLKDGKVVLVRGYGVTKVGGDRQVNSETVFPLASITKNFTATALALLVEEGKLNWDDPVTKHLSKVRFSDEYRTKHLTIRDLLCHRTGLERGDLLPRRGDVSRSDVIERIRYLQPVAGFRSKWGYNNLMYILAGEVVSKVSGMTWEDFVTGRIFKRLKLTSTFAVGDRVRSENRAISHSLLDGKVIAIEAQDRDEVIAPAGSMRSSAQDMAKWLLACLSEEQGNRLLKPKTLREMQSLQMSIPVTWKRGKNVYAAHFYGSGLGWTILDYRGRKICDHAGAAGTMMAIMPQERIGVVVLTNVGWSNLSGMLMYDVFDAYLLGSDKAWDRSKWKLWMKADPHPNQGRLRDLKDAESKRKTGTHTTLALTAFAGRYECDLYGDLTVSHKNDTLLITFGTNGPAKATHWEHDTFYVRRPVASDPDVDWLVSFTVRDGKAQSLSIRRLGWHEPMPTFKRGATK